MKPLNDKQKELIKKGTMVWLNKIEEWFKIYG